MKKLFFFIAAVAVAMTANAKVTTISPDADNDALRLAVHYAEDGDVIEMTEGTYVQCNNGYVAFDGKAVTVRAAEGANVVLQPQVRITLANGGKATFENIKIDASRIHELQDWYEHVFYVEDDTEGKELVMEGCEFYGFDLNKSAIYSKATNKLDLCSLTNCYFHNNDKSCLFFEGESLGELSITNSTFANITAKVTDSYYAGVVDVRSSAAKVTIDHCTFYNCLQMNTDYATVTMKGPQAANVTISNNIFMLPEATDGQRAIRNDVEATNCMTFNYLKDNGGIHSSVTQTNCQLNVDPKFVGATNGNYALAEGSPALTAATNGGAIGDPRWNVVAEPAATEINATATVTTQGQNILLSTTWGEKTLDVMLWQGGATQGFGSYAIEDYAPIYWGSTELTPTTEGVYADNGDGTFTFTCSATDGITQYNITLTGNNPAQGGGEGDVEEPEYPVMEDAITNLVLDLNTMTCKGGPSSSFSIVVELYIGEPNAEGTLFNLTQESTISVMGNPATFVSGYIKDINTSAPSLTAVVVAQLNEYETYQFEIAMSAEEIEAMPIEVTNANITVEEYKPFPEAMPEYSLNMKATWTDAEGITYPVTVKVYTYDPNATEATESLCDVKIGDIINDPWLGGVDGCYLTITTENGVVTATGTISNLNTGFAADFTISGKLPQGPTGVENLNGTVAPVKVIENGQIFIIRNGVKYNAQGAQL